MTGTASRLTTRANIRSHVRERIESEEIEHLYAHVGVLMYLAAVAFVAVIVGLVMRASGVAPL